MDFHPLLDGLLHKPEEISPSSLVLLIADVHIRLVVLDRLEESRHLLQERDTVGDLYRFFFRFLNSFLDTDLTIRFLLVMYCLILLGIFTFRHL